MLHSFAMSLRSTCSVWLWIGSSKLTILKNTILQKIISKSAKQAAYQQDSTMGIGKRFTLDQWFLWPNLWKCLRFVNVFAENEQNKCLGLTPWLMLLCFDFLNMFVIWYLTDGDAGSLVRDILISLCTQIIGFGSESTWSSLLVRRIYLKRVKSWCRQFSRACQTQLKSNLQKYI